MKFTCKIGPTELFLTSNFGSIAIYKGPLISQKFHSCISKYCPAIGAASSHMTEPKLPIGWLRYTIALVCELFDKWHSYYTATVTENADIATEQKLKISHCYLLYSDC